mgnify:CR=1 FL=1
MLVHVKSQRKSKKPSMCNWALEKLWGVTRFLSFFQPCSHDPHRLRFPLFGCSHHLNPLWIGQYGRKHCPHRLKVRLHTRNMKSYMCTWHNHSWLSESCNCARLPRITFQWNYTSSSPAIAGSFAYFLGLQKVGRKTSFKLKGCPNSGQPFRY